MKQNKKASDEVRISSVKQFRETYFPSLVKKEKNKNSKGKDYGNMVAMSILNGIREDLRK